MARLRRSIICAVLILLACIPGHIQAAPPSSPILDMLARVPDVASNRSETHFNDVSAIETAYPPAKAPASMAQVLGHQDTNDTPTKVWWIVFRTAMPPSLSFVLLKEEDMKKAVGFGLPNVQQTLSYGEMPQDVIQIQGKFDLDAIRSTLGTAGFRRADRTDVELWCGSKGCDARDEMDIKAKNNANPFGGTWGRHQPIIIGASYLISSPSGASIDMHISTITGKGASLADSGWYRAAIEAVTQSGFLLRTMILGGRQTLALSSANSFMNLFQDPIKFPPEKIVQILEKELETYQTLPQYELIVLADVVTDTEQVTLMALVYSNADDAQKALGILPARIKTYTSLVKARPLTSVLEDLHIEQVQTQIIDSATAQKTVLLLKFAAPKATTEQILALGATPTAAASKVVSPGAIFNTLDGMLIRQDMNWLSTVPRETLEKQLAGLKK